MKFVRLFGKLVAIIGVAIAASTFVRLKGKTEQANRRGGWRPMNQPRE